jgi:mono/diheme cytochrome c family protein
MTLIRTALLALCLAAAAAPARAEGDPARGEDAYLEACVECHASVARIVRRIAGATPVEKA